MGLMGVMMLTLVSCKTRYITIPEYHEVIVNKHDTLMTRDSIYERDSIYIIKSGDTVTTYKTKYVYMDRWRDRVVYRDSLRVDSVRVPYPVEKKLGLWDRTVLAVAKPIIALVIVALALLLIRYLIRRYSS
jgi:hypothetical protein